MLTYVLAAGANATSSVLQRKAGRRVPQDQNLSLRLIGSLLHQLVWFSGILAVTVGFLLQAAALGNGQLSVVEPILVLELPFTLLLATRVFHSGLHRREWGAIVAMSAGLLYSLSPTSGTPQHVRWYARMPTHVWSQRDQQTAVRPPPGRGLPVNDDERSSHGSLADKEAP